MCGITLALCWLGRGRESLALILWHIGPVFPGITGLIPKAFSRPFFTPSPPPTPLLVGADEKICSYQLSSFRENCPNKYVTISFLRKSKFWQKF